MSEELKEYAKHFSNEWSRGMAVTLPEGLHGGMVRYLIYGIKPGSFLSAFLSNDLMGALGRADDEMVLRMHSIGAFLYNYAPPDAYGSAEKFRDYMAARKSEREAEENAK